MKKIILFSLFGVMIFQACSPNKSLKKRIESKNVTYYDLAGKEIKFLVYDFGGEDGIIWFNMHDDENTAVRAAKSAILKSYGTFVTLRHTGKRLVSFEYNTKKYVFDPNRIYTNEGRKKTLEKYSEYSPEADSVVRKFANFITDSLLKKAKIIITLHNNTAGHYSILDYVKGADYESDAADVFVNPKLDPDDFFYVTDKESFDNIKNAGYNVILQNNENVTDDGSLSVFCGKKSIRYINIEAQRWHKRKQKEMIDFIQKTLKNN